MRLSYTLTAEGLIRSLRYRLSVPDARDLKRPPKPKRANARRGEAIHKRDERGRTGR